MIVRKQRIGNGRQISNFETDERTHYPAFAECVCAENVLNFAIPAKPESGCQITMLGGLLGGGAATIQPIGIGWS
jgi:hypothetical protein